MQIKNRVFTYPVLNNNAELSSYCDANFELLFELVEDKKNITLRDICYKCNSEVINDLIQKGKVKVVCIVECSDTVFRKKYELEAFPKDITILKTDLSEKTVISMFAYATDLLELKANSEIDEDYDGLTFNLEKYNILGANDGFYFNIWHEEKDDNLAKSIFSIIPIDDTDSKVFEVNAKTSKIEISMSRELYNHYKAVYSADVLVQEFFCILLVPALTEAIDKCKEFATSGSITDIDDINSSYVWFRSVSKAFEQLNGHSLSLDEFKDLSSVKLAQMLLGEPLEGALQTIELSYARGGEDE